MKKQILAVAIAASLAVPQVGFAAEDDSGMQYTSASEGLFGSLRTRYNTGNRKNTNGIIEADGSVFGYRGSLDLGNGLTGLYHYEQRILSQEGEELGDSAGKVRYNFVGIRGNFGEVNFGSFGSFVAGVPNVTDVTANGGGNFVPFYRRPNGVQYISPELNGFQAGGHFIAKGGAEATGNPNVQQWAIGGKYKVRGFQVGATYIGDPEGYGAYRDDLADSDDLMRGNSEANASNVNNGMRDSDEPISAADDANAWFVSGKYSQDNWSVAAMYGQKNTSDQLANSTTGTGATAVNHVNIDAGENNAFNAGLGHTFTGNRDTATTAPSRRVSVPVSELEDETYVSVGANVNVGKVGLAVLHDIGSDLKGLAGNDRSVTALSATYNFTSRSRVWVAYIANDRDDQQNEEDQITIGMRMDF